ncbi:MAG: hypothetical protein FWG70_07195 [Oscillospiraceae bacterium]|nr:hypothetical protein [Oscillospiraceae bacterium]
MVWTVENARRLIRERISHNPTSQKYIDNLVESTSKITKSVYERCMQYSNSQLCIDCLIESVQLD